MASKADLERQLAELDQAFQSQQIDEPTYQQGRARLEQLMAQARQPVAAGGSDFFATGGGAPPTASGVRLDQSLQSAGSHGPMQQGQVIRGRYRVEGLIGEGGMGMVYKVHDTLRERALAMKLLHPHFPPEAQQQLAAEIGMQERIRHKGVVRTFDLDVDPETGRYFYTMEFVDGPSLEEHLEQAKQSGTIPPLSSDQILDLLQRLTRVLQVAHQENIVHRDLKPQNILLPKRGGLKLLDFGIAKDMSEQSQHTGFTGTPIYMAPEQLRGGGEVTPAADIYSVGVMLYQFMTGQLFYGRMPGPSEWLVEQGIPLQFPAAIDEVVFKALDFSPTRRYQSMQELLDEFELLVVGGPSAAAHGPVGSAPSRAKSWSEAANAASQVDEPFEEEYEIDEPVTPSRRSARIKGRAPLSGRGAGAGGSLASSVNVSERGSKKKKWKKKKKGMSVVKILLLIFVVAPLGLSVVGAFVSYLVYKNVGSNTSANIRKAITAAANQTPLPPPQIDLKQVNEAFRTTTIPKDYGKITSSYKRQKIWMYEFERAVNEIYGGKAMVWLYSKRVRNKSIIHGFLNTNNRFGYQPSSDTLLFRVVQETKLAQGLAAMRALQRRLKAQTAGGNNWLDNDAARKTIKKAQATLKGVGSKVPMRYRIEDGMGWTYKKDVLPVGAGFHGIAQLTFLTSYYTMSSRKASILAYRKTYRATSGYRTRQSNYAVFVTNVRIPRKRYYRTHPRRTRYRSRYGTRSRTGYRSRYRRSGGKW